MNQTHQSIFNPPPPPPPIFYLAPPLHPYPSPPLFHGQYDVARAGRISASAPATALSRATLLPAAPTAVLVPRRDRGFDRFVSGQVVRPPPWESQGQPLAGGRRRRLAAVPALQSAQDFRTVPPQDGEAPETLPDGVAAVDERAESPVQLVLGSLQEDGCHGEGAVLHRRRRIGL